MSFGNGVNGAGFNAWRGGTVKAGEAKVDYTGIGVFTILNRY